MFGWCRRTTGAGCGLRTPTGAPQLRSPHPHVQPPLVSFTSQVYHSYGDLLQQEFRRTRSLGAFFQGLTPTLVAVVPQIAITVRATWHVVDGCALRDCFV